MALQRAIENVRSHARGKCRRCKGREELHQHTCDEFGVVVVVVVIVVVVANGMREVDGVTLEVFENQKCLRGHN